MRRLTFIIIAMIVAMTGGAFAADVKTQAEKGMRHFFDNNGLSNLEVKINVLKKMSEPKGLYFIEMDMKDKESGRAQKQYAFTDGKYLLPDIIDIKTNSSIKDKLSFETVEPVDLDLSKLTLMEGKKNAKHVIVKVSDFQCPYCKRAYAYLHNKIKAEKLDVAVYMMHLPLAFHKKAELYATIFEAGLLIGNNFGGDLYAADRNFDTKSDEEIISFFAKKAKDEKKFRKLLKSKDIKNKIKAQSEIAASMGITGTPHVFFDGKAVGGFKQSLYDIALKSFK